jgi:starch phosphorylase
LNDSAKFEVTAQEDLRAEIVQTLAFALGKEPANATGRDWLTAAILTARDRAAARWLTSQGDARRAGAKRVYYLSLEFLIGRLLRDALSNLGLLEPMRDALHDLGQDFDVIAALEPDAALGNGGLGRLAACFMESMASLNIPAVGYGIRYRHGLFRQRIVDGEQVEEPEDWLAHGNPWEFERPERQYRVGFGGSAEKGWQPSERVVAVAYDTPICGWRGRRVNTLRLWSSIADVPFSLEQFNRGDHVGAQSEAARADSITRVLYPSDTTAEGRELRLRQEYFFTSASLQDLVARHVREFSDARTLADKAAIQLNDTHPAVAIAELVRLLCDEHGMTFEDAFRITRAATAYTNHTLLPEALESWPLDLFQRLLPRHMQIVYAINERISADAHARKLTDFSFLSAISVIDEGERKRVRMGQLAFAGSHSINGVSALHSRLMKETVFRELSRLYPDRINNKTNGVSPRRWLLQINPGLCQLIRDAIGDGFLDDAERLHGLDRLAADGAFGEAAATVKRAAKEKLARLILERTAIAVDPAAIFDVQIKRIHEYKRQLLAALEAVARYEAIRAEPRRDWTPRVKIFAGKAAASYAEAKTIIRLINDIGQVINADPAVRGLIKVVFLPNYNVSLAESIIPAADLSEQISTAGMEASGTGNMKLALNGALTVGTLDGANIEILERAGADNLFMFGLTAAEVEERRRSGHDPRASVAASPLLTEVLDEIDEGRFSAGEPGCYRGLIGRLLERDWFMVTADFAAYLEALAKAEEVWRTPALWRRKAVHNTARLGWFSSDRTIREYARDIWKVPVS